MPVGRCTRWIPSALRAVSTTAPSSVGGHLVRYLNEYMTVEVDGVRVATYPDVIATLSLEDGRPVSIAEMTEGREVALFAVDQSLVPLSSSTRDRFALEEVEKIMGIALVGYGPAEDAVVVSSLPAPDLGRVADDLEDPRLVPRPGGARAGRAASSPVSTAPDASGSPAGWRRQVWQSRRTRPRTSSEGCPVQVGCPAPIVTGSHTDTVYGGGRFDGIIGVLGAIEAVRCLRQGGPGLAHDLVVVDFLGEEPNDFGLSCVGSRAIVGLARRGPPRPCRARTDAAWPRRIAASGGQPSALAAARWPDDLHCYLELHIEQGPVLERARVPIGVVTGIVGIHRLLADIEGQPDHAGTTPMDLRRDALGGAAEAVLAIERLADGGVATVGRLEIRPGAQNVVPASAELWAEARSPSETWLEDFGRRITEELGAIGARRHLATSLSWISRAHPVTVTGWVADAIAKAARSLGIEPLNIPSGAGHDASHMARLGPMGMVFVPSRAGRSHCPEEWTDLEDIGRGIAVLAQAMTDLRLTERSSAGGGARRKPCMSDSSS